MVIKEKWFSSYIEKEIPDLSGKKIAITGTTSGTGFYTAICAIRKHADTLFLMNRQSERVIHAKNLLEQEKFRVNSNTKLFLVDCNLGDFENVREAAASIEKLTDILDVFVSNAGIYVAPVNASKDGYNTQMQVNVLSPFILIESLAPLLNKSHQRRGMSARIAFVTSIIRFSSEPCFDGLQKAGDKIASSNLYGASKIHLTGCAFEFNRRNDTSKVFALVADPGMSETAIMGPKGELVLGNAINDIVVFIMRMFGFVQSAADGAMLLCKAAFGNHVKAGDLWQPGGVGGLYGLPIRTVEDGKSSVKGEEKMLNPDFGRRTWETITALF